MPRTKLTLIAIVLSLSVACALGARRAASPSPSQQPPNGPGPSAAPAPVPREYQAVYDWLESAIAEYRVEHAACQDSGAPGGPSFGAELLPANGNRGAALLDPTTIDVIRLYLDSLQNIGVQGVTVQIPVPLLSADFPSSEEYLDFYRQLGEEVRRRDLSLLVEAGAVFPDPQFSGVNFDFSGFTPTTYYEERTRELALIAAEVRPDYLSFGEEPSTERMITGLPITAGDYESFLSNTLQAIGESESLLGAGTGTWEDPAYYEALRGVPGLDFIDLHVYPLRSERADFFARTAEIGREATANGQRVLIGETWLYKVLPSELGRVPYQEAYARDPFSFWAPLDSEYLRAVGCIAREGDFEYVSFFWSGLFFSYLDYDETPRDLTPVELVQATNRAVLAELLAGGLSPTGSAYQELLQDLGSGKAP